MKSATRIRSSRRQRGVGTLIVVMVLFFVVSLVAAYTSRNLIFEQRTSANQYRSTQALEAAEAGLEWAIAMLNHSRITASCGTSTSTGDTSFRDRYLNISAPAGTITVRKTSAGDDLLPSCVFNGSAWTCSCPASGAPSLTAPTGTGVYPAFRVRFVQVPGTGTVTQPGVVRVEANGCTRMDDNCLNFEATGVVNEGRAYASALVALTGGPVSLPRAAVTTMNGITLSGGGIYNADIAVQSGGPAALGGAALVRAAGSPGPSTVIQNDTTLSGLGSARMFPAVFNMWSANFRAQPAALVLNCSASTCNAAAVRAAISFNPGRPIWVNGDLAIDSAGGIGSATAPALLVVTGDVTVTANAPFYGVLYVQRASWTDMGAASVFGAVVVEGAVAAGTPSITYDPALLNVTRNTIGSFVRVPGGWRDFPEE